MTGTVTCEGVAVSGATVAVAGRSATANASGAFTVTSVPGGACSAITTIPSGLCAGSSAQPVTVTAGGLVTVFGVVFTALAGAEFGTRYFAGYLVEKSLSVDNLFAFVIIMTTFAVPEAYQHKALSIGILIALILRAIFIALGAALISLFSFMFLVFGALLIWTAIQLYRHRNEDPDVGDDLVVRLTRRVLPVTTQYRAGRLVSRHDGRRSVTPLFVVALILAFVGVKLVLHYGHTVDDRVPERRRFRHRSSPPC